jgi:ABC-type nitrate/sulfonate/bicarbonate transport system substrate-binding protein
MNEGHHILKNSGQGRQPVLAARIAIIAAIFIMLLGSGRCQGGYSGQMESITVAYSPFESCIMFLVAEDQQFFARNGLDLVLYRSDSGAAALDYVLDGEADLAVSVSEFPLVRKVFQGTSARAVASIDKAEYIYIVSRKDRGIQNPSDLRGKRIGTVTGSIAEFHLGRFLTLNGFGIHDIEYVSVSAPPELSNAVVDGSLDAGVLAQPYADQASERLGENAIVWPAQSRQPLYALVVSTEQWIAGHPELVERFLKSLAQAEQYMFGNPAEAKAIAQERLDLDASSTETVWSQNQFTISLDQSLIAAMEDESRWMIENGLTTETQVPDFNHYIWEDGLKAVKPEAVKIIR